MKRPEEKPTSSLSDYQKRELPYDENGIDPDTVLYDEEESRTAAKDIENREIINNAAQGLSGCSIPIFIIFLTIISIMMPVFLNR